VNTTNLRTSVTAIVATAVAVAISGGFGGSIDASTAPPNATDAADDDQLAAAIQAIIDASIAPGAVDWNCCGEDLPATGVIVGVRLPGRDDILLAAGTYLDDGSALDPLASFSTANLGYSIVAEIGLKLVADGTLDPEATIDAWLPDAPNADRITVGMLIDSTHGWGDYGEVLGQNVTADLERHWTSAEAVATLQDVAPAAEPGTFVGDGVGSGTLALGYVAEQVTGDSLADLVASTIADPAGLEHTFLSDGSDLPGNYQYGRFFLEDGPLRSTAEAPLAAYFTFAPAEDAFVSTVPDLLDLLDTWVDGTWRPGATPPAPSMFVTYRMPAAEYVGDPPRYIGLDVPYTGYCPCQLTSDGHAPDAIGRRPATFGTDVHLFHYPDDDISIVLHYNSNTWAERSQIEAVLADIRATVAASI
jgi:CubicO group peptidase (beta-lactamase class C family)